MWGGSCRKKSDSGCHLVVKLTGFGGGLNVKKTKSNITPFFDLSKGGDAIS